MSSRVVELENGFARIGVRPDLGAGLTCYDIFRDGEFVPVLRRVDPQTAHPFSLSNIVLVPFSGRVSRGGFTFGNSFHAIEPNMPGQKHPVHGSGFSSAWAVTRQSSVDISLALSGVGPGPFVYNAVLNYQLDGRSLIMTMNVTNRASVTLPYGSGFHPWFVRDDATYLTAPAKAVWLEDEDHLPAGSVPVGDRPDMDFTQSRRLPDQWINNCFSGWTGHGQIDWPKRRVSAAVWASAEISHYVVFSPSADADFFCFEPVNHSVDAFNLPGGPQAHGMKLLPPGASSSVSMVIAPAAT